MGSNATLVTLSSCFPMKLRGPKNKNLYDTIKRSIQFIRVTRSVSIVDCQQSFFVSLVDLVSERKLGRAEVSFALADFEIDEGKKEALIAVCFSGNCGALAMTKGNKKNWYQTS